MQLSDRLLAVAEMVTPGSRLVDVGTDHGYIPIFLVQKKKIPSAIAMDVNEGPLKRAVQHIQENGLQAYIETRLSDGVQALLQNEGDSVLIAGMGGALVQKILMEGREVLQSVSELILQPQSEIGQVRQYLATHGFQIISEDMVLEDGKYYSIMKAVHGTMKYETPILSKYGSDLLKKRHPVLKQYLLKEKAAYEKIAVHLRETATLHANTRIKEIEQELQHIIAALTYYEK